MTSFFCWEEEYGEKVGRELAAPMAYMAAQKYSELTDRQVLEYPLCRTVCVKHPEGFVDIFEVELSSTPIYTAKRKKPQ